MSTATLQELEQAAEVVHATFGPTPQYHWPLLSARSGCETWVKHENHTPTGAFKIRGGLVYMAERAAAGMTGGVIAASTGNHGQSIAVAATRYGIRPVIVVPEGNSPEKNALMKAQGAELVVHGWDFQAAYEHARDLAAAEDLFMMPSFDETLVKGVGTYGLELFRQVPDLDAVYVPIGLGSGICGVISARDATGSKAEVIGVVAEGAPTYKLSFDAGECVSSNRCDTFAAGVACRVPVQEAVETICKGAARIVVVTDDEIKAAMRAYFSDTHNVAEGAGAAPLAALLQEKDRMRGLKAAAILTGANADRDQFAEIMNETGGGH